MPYVECINCGKGVYRRPSYLKEAMNIFCSKRCESEWKRSLHPEGNCICFLCGCQFRTNPAYVRRRPTHKRFCSRSCFAKYRQRNKGKCLTGRDGGGYHGTGCVRTRYHRTLIERAVGRKLNSDEVVHHIDGNKDNNDIGNLRVMTKKDHHSIHSTEYWKKHRTGIVTECFKCGRKKYLPLLYIKTKYNGNFSKVKKYMCKDCYGKYGRSEKYK